jgi:polyhydroxybutyrate depolymerase
MRMYELFDEIVKTYSEQYCIDMDRIFVVWHSLGGWATNTLACARGDMIRGSASIGWSVTASACTGPVSALIMHHPEDRLASFQWWVNARDLLLEQNSCNNQTTPLSWWPHEWNCELYTSCQDWAWVTRCPHSDSTAYDWRYYPHTWPNFAGETIRNFFDWLK